MIDRSLNYGRHIVKSFLAEHGPYSEVVDLGAGEGTDLSIAKECCPSARLHAIECWPPYAESLRGQGVSVHSLNIERDCLPFADASIDVILANQILEHTKELFWIFHEATRVLKVNGHFIIGVPNLASLHNRLLLMVGRQPTQIKSASAHVRGFTKPDLLQYLHECFPQGYSLEQFAGSNFYPFPGLVARPLAVMLPTMSWAIFLLLKKVKTYNRQFVEYPRDHQLETNFYCGEEAAELS